MSIAPAPYLEACLAVLYRACISGRLLGWSGEQSGLTATQSGELADLLDAVHNLPHLIQHWEECDEPPLRQFLAAFDDKWKASGRGDPLAAYEDVLARRPAAPGSAERDPATVFELRSVHGGALLSFEGRVPRDLEGYDGQRTPCGSAAPLPRLWRRTTSHPTDGPSSSLTWPQIGVDGTVPKRMNRWRATSRSLPPAIEQAMSQPVSFFAATPLGMAGAPRIASTWKRGSSRGLLRRRSSTSGEPLPLAIAGWSLN